MTVRNEWVYTYSVNMSDGVNLSNASIRIVSGVSSVPEAELDEAAQAFAQSLNGWMPVTSVDKITEVVEQDTFDWDGA